MIASPTSEAAMDAEKTHPADARATDADLTAFLGDNAGNAADLPAWLLPSYLREDDGRRPEPREADALAA